MKLYTNGTELWTKTSGVLIQTYSLYEGDLGILKQSIMGTLL